MRSRQRRRPSSEVRKLHEADVRTDAIVALVVDGAASDVLAFVEIARKVDAAANTREACARTAWSAEEMYQVVRLAQVGVVAVNRTMIGRDRA